MKHLLKKVALLTTFSTITLGGESFASTLTVQKGDTLFSLASKHNVSVDSLKTENKLSTNNIYIGQKLSIPGASALTVTVPATHIVQSGETLFSIAKKYSISAEQLKQQNKLTTTTIYVGQKLTIQAGLNSTSPTSTPTVYTVQSGDYLLKISRLFNLDYKKIVEWNNLSSLSLRVGQKLYVSQPSTPDTTPTSPADSVSSPPSTNPSATTYAVKPGDYLAKIAPLYNLTVSELQQLNNLSSNLIYVGQKLIVSPSAFIKPSLGAYTSEFGPRWGTNHHGIDIAKPGTISVRSAAAGTVHRSYYSSSYGHVVFVKHVINGKNYETIYAHLRNRAVVEGQAVAQGQFLGYMGNTGHSTGQHLHFEVHAGEWNATKTDAVNPRLFLP